MMKLPQDKPDRTTYVLHCDYCSFHRVTDGTDFKLVEIPLAKVPRGVPRLEKGKIVTPKPIPRLKQFKCPNCGRGVTARTSSVKKSVHEKPEEKENLNGQESDLTGREAGSFGQPLPGESTPGLD